MSKRLHFFIFFWAALFSSSAVYSQCLSLSVTTSNASCFSGNDGAITLTINPGTAPDAQPPFDIELFFRDSNGRTQLAFYDNVAFTSITFTPGNGSLNVSGADAFGIPANAFIEPGSDYVIDVRSTGGSIVCRNKTVFTSISSPSEITIDALTSQNATCNGANDGQISVDAVSGGAGAPYQYSVDGGNVFQASKNFNGLFAGTYNVVVRDASGCESSATPVTITSFATVTIDALTSQNVSCNGGNDGQIVVTTVSGGDGGPYEYSIDGGGTFQAGNTFAGLTPNIYNVVVRDATGCLSGVTPINVTQPAQPVSGSTTQVDVLCFGQSTGSITITGAGGVGPYDFSIDGGTTYAALNAADQTFPNLAAGPYSLMVRDANGCESPVIAVTINEPAAAVTGSTSKIDVACFGSSTGSITITGSGGIAPYDFSIDGGATFAILDAPNHDFTNLPAGSYNLAVRDANGCISPLIPVTIAEPAATVGGTTAQVDVNCFGGNNGSITITGTGGVAPYDFSIDGGASYTAIDAANHTFPTLLAGTYNLVVRDANGCTSPAIPVTISEPASAVNGNTSKVDVLCFGANSGSITITGTGGVAPYDFSIDGGATYPVTAAAANTFSNLLAGNYNLLVRDANGCISAAIPVAITEPAAAVSGTTTQIDVACFGGNTGAVTITGTGGVAPYDFSIDGGATYLVQDASDNTFSSLTAGPYDLMVRDANGCVSSVISVAIAEPASGVTGTTTQVDVACFGESTGSIAITGTGGVGPYDFSIDGGASYPALDAANNTFPTLPAATYNLVVRDANGCASPVIPVTIAEPAAALTISPAKVDVSCFGASDGSISITPSGGTGPYDFSSDGGATYAVVDLANHTFSSLAAAAYNVRVRDFNGCESPVVPVTITEPPEVTAVISALGAVTVCEGSALPDIVFTFTGVAPFDFSYTDGVTPVTITDHPSATFTISGAPAGTYAVTSLTDDNGCVSTNLGGSIAVAEEPAATVEAGNTQIICSSTTTTLSGSSFGGAASTGAWSIVSQPAGGDGLLSDVSQTVSPSSVTFTATIPGDYTLRLTTDDPAGVCAPVTDDVVITVTATATVDAGTPQTICNGGTATLAGSFTATTGITWTTSGDGAFDDASSVNAVYTPGPNDITAKTVTLTITTAGPCAPVSDNVVITIIDAPTVDAGTPQTICSSASIVLNGSFGGSATGLLWSTSGDGGFDDNTDVNASYSPGPNDAVNGTVTLTATATGSCAGTSDNVVITVNPAATVDAGNPQTVCNGNTVDLDATIGGGAASMTWMTSGDGTFNINTDPDAVYTPGPNDISTGTVTLTATTNNPAGPCPAVTDNVVITLMPIPGDQTTAGTETWIGYAYDDTGDLSALATRINFANAKYRGFIEANDIDNMSPASTYDVATDEFDLNLGLAEAIQGPNVCGTLLDHFSLRYKMDKTLTAGVYRFTIGADDGIRLLIDGVNVIPAAAFNFQSYTTYTSGALCLSAGVHTFEIHYFDNAAYSRLSFAYEELLPLVSSPVDVCVNSAAPVLTASSTDPDVVDYNWYKNGTLVFTGANYTPAASELDMTTAGSADFDVTAVFACGETQPATVAVNVLNSAALAITDQTICESGGVVDLRAFATPTPAGGSFVFAGHPNISGDNFDPTGLAGNTIAITVDYSTASCTAPQQTLNLTISNTATTTVPPSVVAVCEGAPDLDLTTLVSAVPAGGVFTFAGNQVAGNFFDPSGLSGAQTITVDYSIAGCAAMQTTFDIDVTAVATLTTMNANACQNGSMVNLLTLVSGVPSGGTFTFTGPGVTGTMFDPSAQSGTININVNYDVYGCTGNGALQITVLSPSDPLCVGGNCSSVVITPQPEPATCTNSDGRLVMNIQPATPAVNNTGIKITIDGVSSTNLPISRTQFNNNAFEALPVGRYNYTIEYGDPGCIKTGMFSIDQSGTVGTPVASNISNPVCVGSATGSLILDVPGETGNVLEWSLDAGLTDPFKPFTAGGQITGIPAGAAPTFQQVISVRRNAADVCYSSVTIPMSESVTTVSATFNVNAATCNGNDGAITNILAAGGHGGPYAYSIDGGQSFQTAVDFNGLAGGTYTLRVRDNMGCASDLAANVTFPGFINSAISKSNADCTNDGNSGTISVAVNDPGVFQVALSTDQFNPPADAGYISYTSPAVSFAQLPRGQYFVYVRSGSAACPTRSAPIDIFGVYDVSFGLEADCNNNELSLALVNITGEVGGAPLEIQISKKLSSAPPEIIYEQFPADGEIYLDYDKYAFLKTPGEYRVQVIQFQSEVVCNLPSDIIDFTVPVALNAGIGTVAESYPDIPSGKLSVINFTGGVYPYDVRIELDSASSFSLPYHATEFEEAGLNSNQQIEMSYQEIPAGRYIVQVKDSLGCILDLTARVPLDGDLYIPNVFTPNGDGSNDVFFIRNLPQEGASNQLVISNRWGKEVFVSDNYQNNWDGTGAADGIYFYRLQVSDSQSLTGWLEIIRGPKP